MYRGTVYYGTVYCGTMVGEQNDQLAEETLEELDWCLDQLQHMQTHRSVGDLATDKVKRSYFILLLLKDFPL